MVPALLAILIAQAAALIATPLSVALHPGAAATLTITGATGTLTATATQAFVTVSVDQTTHTITVTAPATPGNDIVHVADTSGATVDVPVRVAQDAGTVPAQMQLRVTGSDIDPMWLGEQIARLVSHAVVAQPGAVVSVDPVASPQPPSPGATEQVTEPVTIAGNGTFFDVTGETTVTVTNVPVEPFAPPVLFYDDDPERINADGVLYRADITASTPARLYYYHDAADAGHRLAVVLRAQRASSVQVIDSSSGPNIDVMSVGHAVTRNFLLMDPRNEGIVVDVDATAPVVLHDIAMSAGQGVAGNVDVQVLSGGPVSVTVLAVPPGADPRTMQDGPLLPSDGHHRTGVFSLTNYGTDALAYTVGGADASLVYGDRERTPPNLDAQSPGHDYGEYGVLRTLLFSLDNPTASPATVYLYERPIGGVVRSSFLVDGTLADIGCVRVPMRYQIAAFVLAPGGRYHMNVLTMTDGSSNYPIEVGLSTTAPEPSAPPISAPDGCFPKPQTSPSPAPTPS